MASVTENKFHGRSGHYVQSIKALPIRVGYMTTAPSLHTLTASNQSDTSMLTLLHDNLSTKLTITKYLFNKLLI